MSARRSSRSATLASVTALLDQVAPIHRALCAEMAGLAISGEHYRALDRATDALARLAADLGYPGRFSAQAPRANLG